MMTAGLLACASGRRARSRCAASIVVEKMNRGSVADGKQGNAMVDRWDCAVIARRVHDGVDEVLVQWDCTWMEEGGWPAGQVIAELLRRIVAGKQQVLVQWKCTWVPVAFADAGALVEYEERCRGEVAAEGGTGSVPAVSAPKRVVRKRKNRGW